MDYRRDTRESHIVFVGNLPFDTTEEQLVVILRQAGPVSEFRLVFDRDSGKQRGYGFCEYADSKIAVSAVKNLNGTLVSGRPMKLDFADRDVIRRQFGTDGLTISGGTGGLSANPENFEHNGHGAQSSASSTSAKIVGPEQVHQLVGSLNDQQKAELIAQFKTFAQRNLRVARAELVENPALAHALVDTLVSLNLADRNTLMRTKNNGIGRNHHAAPGMSRPPVPPSHPPMPPPNMMGAPQRAPMRPSPTSLPTAARIALPSQPPAPAMPPSSVAPAPAPATAPAPAPPSDASGMNNEQVLLQLISLTDEQLAQLPPEHRQQIIELKQQLQGSH